MRRAVSVLSIGALVAGLLGGAVSAATLPSSAPAGISLAQELFRRCFGETADPGVTGDSPLGSYAFRVTDPLLAVDQLPPLDLARFSVAQTAALIHLAPPTPDATVATDPVPSTPAAVPTTLELPQLVIPTIGYYQQAQPRPTRAPSSAGFDLPSRDGRSSLSFSPLLSPTSGFTASSVGSDSSDALPQLTGNVAVPMRLGHVHLQTHADAGQARSDALAYNDTAMGGGATFDARLGKWKQLGVDLSSHYEHLTVDQPLFSASSVDGTSNLSLTNDHLPVFVPAYADISKHTISAGLNVPVSQRMTASLQVDSQHLLGGYGTPGLANLDANNMIYGARLTYQLKGSGAISFSAKQYRYQDNLIPANAFVQTSANLNYTIKF